MLKYVVAHFEKNMKALELGQWQSWVLLPYKLPPLSHIWNPHQLYDY